MKPTSDKQKVWQLARERFHIPDPFPPKPLRPERTIGAILAEIQGDQPTSESAPEILQARWTAIAGEQIALHTYPACLRGPLLIVYADHPGWLTQIRRIPLHHLLKKIASIPEAPEIRSIRFQLDPSLRTYRKK